MPPTATQAGLLYPPLPSGRAYLSRNVHRHTAPPSPHKNRWSEDCLPDCEHALFAEADLHDWRDERPHLWGVRQGLPVIGLGDRRLAKFPEPQNNTDPWHGYPVSATDTNRELEHRPQAGLVRRWVEAGLISAPDGSRINRGKV